MSHFTCCTRLLLVLHLALSASKFSPVIIPGDETCPSQESRDRVLRSIRATIEEATTQGLEINLSCGSGEWSLVAHLNMSNSSQQCPAAWTENSTDGVRTCGRPLSNSGSCLATLYPTGRQYIRVCGRVIGYQYGSTDAFGYQANATIDSYYVYGVSITHGTPRNHIWTFAAGVSEGGHSPQSANCPCSNPGHPGNSLPPSFVGDNYYCESGNPARTFFHDRLFSADPLWDGQQCEGQCCSNGKSPPWFSMELPNTTTDDIEVRICVAQASFDDIKIQLLELYVQ